MVCSVEPKKKEKKKEGVLRLDSWVVLVVGGLSRDPMGRRVVEVSGEVSRAGEDQQERERSLDFTPPSAYCK